MSDSLTARVAIVAAMEREVAPLVKGWRVVRKEHDGRSFRFYESGTYIVVCGGVGAEAARRAAEAVIALYQPGKIYSAGFAGALGPEGKVGEIVEPRTVINAGDGSRVVLPKGVGVLVSFGAVAGVEQKAQLRKSYSAQAVDMEAAAVARAAELRGVEFGAVKAISDEFDFEFPGMARFVDGAGQFSEMKFAGYAAVRPWMWPVVFRMARASRKAARALSARLAGLASAD
jgi:adenosylhomocysteine nucleosidase